MTIASPAPEIRGARAFRLAAAVALPLACASLLLAGAACGDSSNNGAPADAPVVDSPSGGRIDAAPDASIDAAIDGGVTVVDDGSIAAAIAAADGDNLSLAIHGAVVTYLKPAVGIPTVDPAGFTIQASRTGAALMIGVDPTTITPTPAVGDVVDFTITSKHTVSGQPRALAITQYTRTATGIDVGTLTQDLSSATDVVTAINHYDSELVTISGSLVNKPLAGASAGFERSPITTVGIPNDANLQIRVPITTINAIDLVPTCQFTVTRVPMGQFNTQAQIAAFNPADFSLHGCPAPFVTGANSTSPITVRILFSRNIAPASVKADGSQFTFTGGLTATAATASGRTVTITTTMQVAQQAYTTTIAPTVTDLQGSSVADTTDALFDGFATPVTGSDGAALSIHTTLGIPAATSTASPSDDFLSIKGDYVVSYNGTRRVPNWVSWELNTSYLGSVGRQNNFRTDDTFPVTEPQASLADYQNSGFERGHMCPSADRTLTVAANSETFFLTNMVPQSANNNEGPWADFENYLRTLAQGGSELFIVSGGTFGPTPRHVGDDAVVVPDATWKVVTVLDAVGQGPANVTTATRVIAVLMPNDDTMINKTDLWRQFRVSVDQIEQKTGFDFFSDVDPNVQAVIEARVDNQ